MSAPDSNPKLPPNRVRLDARDRWQLLREAYGAWCDHCEWYGKPIGAIRTADFVMRRMPYVEELGEAGWALGDEVGDLEFYRKRCDERGLHREVPDEQHPAWVNREELLDALRGVGS